MKRIRPELSSVFAAALADFDGELRDAGSRRWRRLIIRCRWYCALGVLLIVAPLTVPVSPVSGAAKIERPRTGGSLIALMSVALFAAMWSLWGWFVLGAIVSGLALAATMRAWHNRHPATAVVNRVSTRLPEINLSSIPVSGDIAGLLFAAGSVVLVVAGLPGLRWLFVSIVVTGFLIAWALLALHAPGRSGSEYRTMIAPPR